MSKIQQFGRRYETFDASNTEHRAIFHGVLKYRTWGRAPIRFWAGIDSSGSNSLMDQCIREIGKYYMETEFGSLVNDNPFDGLTIRTIVKSDIQK